MFTRHGFREVRCESDLNVALSKHPSEVREIPSAIVEWMATGNKEWAFSIGKYRTVDDLDAAVAAVANSLGTHGEGLLSGGAQQWEKAAELLVTRRWISPA